MRRTLLPIVLPSAVILALGTAFLPAQETRYSITKPIYETRKPEPPQTVADLIAPDTQAVVLGSGYGFCEGPAADRLGNIYFSDGKKNAIHFYPYGREVQLFTDKTTDANGMMFAPNGELYVCEGAAFRVVAFDLRSSASRVLAEKIDGGRFNEPNDLAVDADGGFYFTDPNYRHGNQETVRKEDTYYCATDGTITRVSTVCEKPNGVLLSEDGKTLFLADNGGKCVYQYDVTGPGKLENERLFTKLGGGPDGLCLDRYGDLYVACGRVGIEVYATRGPKAGEKIAILGKEHGIPYASNCTFGGPDRKILYITSADKFLGLEMKVSGARPVCEPVHAP